MWCYVYSILVTLILQNHDDREVSSGRLHGFLIYLRSKVRVVDPSRFLRYLFFITLIFNILIGRRYVVPERWDSFVCVLLIYWEVRFAYRFCHYPKFHFICLGNIWIILERNVICLGNIWIILERNVIYLCSNKASLHEIFTVKFPGCDDIRWLSISFALVFAANYLNYLRNFDRENLLKLRWNFYYFVIAGTYDIDTTENAIL